MKFHTAFVPPKAAIILLILGVASLLLTNAYIRKGRDSEIAFAIVSKGSPLDEEDLQTCERGFLTTRSSAAQLWFAHSLAFYRRGDNVRLIKYFRDNLKSNDAWLRRQSAVGIGMMGERGNDAIPDLKHAFGDPKGIEKQLIEASGALGPSAACLLPSIVPFMTDHAHPDLRSAAIEAIGNFGPKASEISPALLDMLVDEKCRDVWWIVADALFKIGNYSDVQSLAKIEFRMKTGCDVLTQTKLKKLLSGSG